MIKDIKLWEEFEDNLLKNSKPDYQKNVKIFNVLYEQAIMLKALPYKNPLEGIESKIRIAKYINQDGK